MLQDVAVLEPADKVVSRLPASSLKAVFDEASLIPRRAIVMTRYARKKQFQEESFVVSLISNGKSFPVDIVATSRIAGKSLQDKEAHLYDVYARACSTLDVSFHKGVDIPDTALWFERKEAYNKAAQEGIGVMAGWTVQGPVNLRDFILEHKGLDRVRTAVALATGTEARRNLGWESDLHRRTVAAVKFKL